MIKIEEGNFSAKGDSFKLTVEFEVLCRCFREMLVERLIKKRDLVKNFMAALQDFLI